MSAVFCFVLCLHFSFTYAAVSCPLRKFISYFGKGEWYSEIAPAFLKTILWVFSVFGKFLHLEAFHLFIWKLFSNVSFKICVSYSSFVVSLFLRHQVMGSIYFSGPSFKALSEGSLRKQSHVTIRWCRSVGSACASVWLNRPSLWGMHGHTFPTLNLW